VNNQPDENSHQTHDKIQNEPKSKHKQKSFSQSVTNSGMGSQSSLFLATTTIQRKSDEGGLNKRDEDYRWKERNLLSRDPPPSKPTNTEATKSFRGRRKLKNEPESITGAAARPLEGLVMVVRSTNLVAPPEGWITWWQNCLDCGGARSLWIN